MYERPLSREVPSFFRGQFSDDVTGGSLGSIIANLGKKLLTSDKIHISAVSAAEFGAKALLKKGADAAKNKILSSSKIPEAVKKDIAENYKLQSLSLKKK